MVETRKIKLRTFNIPRGVKSILFFFSKRRERRFHFSGRKKKLKMIIFLLELIYILPREARSEKFKALSWMEKSYRGKIT